MTAHFQNRGPRRLRAWLLGLALITLLPSLGIGLIAAWQLATNLRELGEGRLQATARALAAALDESLETYIAVGRTLAASPALAAGGELGAFRRQAEVGVAELGAWASLIGPGPGYPRLLNTRIPAGQPLPEGLVLPPDRAPVPRVFASGQVVVSDVASGPHAGGPSAVVFLPVRSPESEAVRLVLGIGFDPNRLSRLLEAQHFDNSAVAGVMDSQDNIIARSRDHALYAGRPAPGWVAQGGAGQASGLLRGPSFEGVPLVLAFHRLQRAPWTVLVAMPADVLAGGYRTPLAFLLGGGLALLGLAAWLAMALARRLLQPIAALAAAAEGTATVEPGDATPLPKVPPSEVLEIEVLRRSLLRADQALRDRATTAQRAAAQQRLLAAELSHRVKNALAVVQAALRLTPRHSLEGYTRAVEGRVAALARANGLLAARHWEGAQLRSLVESELTPFLHRGHGGGPSATLAGPPVTLAAAAVQPLAMVLHELATNAVKYGALSVAGGRLSLAWERAEAAGLLVLRWTESNGPALPGVPQTTGFGSRVIRATVQDQLGGRVSKQWLADGMICTVELPLHRAVQEEDGPPACRRGAA